jgi:hypothetical protein
MICGLSVALSFQVLVKKFQRSLHNDFLSICEDVVFLRIFKILEFLCLLFQEDF